MPEIDWSDYLTRLQSAVGDLRLKGDNLKKAEAIYASLSEARALLGDDSDDGIDGNERVM